MSATFGLQVEFQVVIGRYIRQLVVCSPKKPPDENTAVISFITKRAG